MGECIMKESNILNWKKGYIIKVVAYLLLILSGKQIWCLILSGIGLVISIIVYKKLKESEDINFKRFFSNWITLLVPYIASILLLLSTYQYSKFILIFYLLINIIFEILSIIYFNIFTNAKYLKYRAITFIFQIINIIVMVIWVNNLNISLLKRLELQGGTFQNILYIFLLLFLMSNGLIYIGNLVFLNQGEKNKYGIRKHGRF